MALEEILSSEPRRGLVRVTLSTGIKPIEIGHRQRMSAVGSGRQVAVAGNCEGKASWSGRRRFLNEFRLPTNGDMTELIHERCAPRTLSAIDPSVDQIAFAKTKRWSKTVDFQIADAKDLPFDDDTFDVAVMGLVITFVGDQRKAVTEMKRVVRPDGTMATYIWDIPGGGHFQQPIRDAVRSMGVDVPPNKNDEITRTEVLANLFSSAGLDAVSSRTIEIQATFPNFEDYWHTQTIIENNTIRPIRAMSDADVERLKALLRETLPMDSVGRISYSARCNAVKGIVPYEQKV